MRPWLRSNALVLGATLACAMVLCSNALAADPALAGVKVQRMDRGAVASQSTTVGWAFETTRPIQLTKLGFFDAGRDGLDVPHNVGIWDQHGNLLGWAFVDEGTDAPLVGRYRYARIRPSERPAHFAPLVLPAGETFVIGATVRWGTIAPACVGCSGGIGEIEPFPFKVDSRRLRVHAALDLLNAGLRDVVPADTLPLLNYPENVLDGVQTLAPNFLFRELDVSHHSARLMFRPSDAIAVPEPQCLILLVVPAMGLARRRFR